MSRFRVLAAVSVVGVSCGLLHFSHDQVGAYQEIQECTQEQNGNEGCNECIEDEEDEVSYTCPTPHPQNEFCQGSLTDDDACIVDNAGCPNNAIIWTRPQCSLGTGTSHQTTTACSATGIEFYYQAATNVTGGDYDCDGDPFN